MLSFDSLKYISPVTGFSVTFIIVLKYPSASLTGVPPFTETLYVVLMFARLLSKYTYFESCDHPDGVSLPSCHVSLLTSPPSTGTIYTSLFPFTSDENAIYFPSGETFG